MSIFERFIASLLGSLIGAYTGMTLALYSHRLAQKRFMKKVTADLEDAHKRQAERIREACKEIMNGEDDETEE